MSERRRVALVTGGTRGIGLGCAQALAAEGFDLFLAGRRPEKECAPALEALRRRGVDVAYGVCDVSDRRQRHALVETLKSRFERLHVLVNNAGMAPRQRRDLLSATEESFEEVLRTNLQGPYFLTQSVANWMLEQRVRDAGFKGCIINISSVSAEMASIERGEYCISKAGVAMATRLWAVRLANTGIGVYEVRPGIVATDMTAGVKDKYDRRIAEGLVPQGRWGQPEDVGRIVAAFARGDFAYATGQVACADGGMNIPRL